MPNPDRAHLDQDASEEPGSASAGDRDPAKPNRPKAKVKPPTKISPKPAMTQPDSPAKGAPSAFVFKGQPKPDGDAEVPTFDPALGLEWLQPEPGVETGQPGKAYRPARKSGP